ncbi:hypothetical protein ES703_123597 [subsurface metagenome]
MKSINYEHVAQRKTFVGLVYNRGSKEIKETILNKNIFFGISKKF